MTDGENLVTVWMRRLRWSLGSLSQEERDDIAREVQSHLDELIATGVSAEDAIAQFGAPYDYARGFLDEREIASALGSERAGVMLSAVGRRVHRDAAAAIAVFAAFLFGMLAFVCLLAVVFKIADPVHVGLWVGPNEFFLGWIDDPAGARDLLGNWLYPLAALLCAVAWLLARAILAASLRAIARQSNSSGARP